MLKISSQNKQKNIDFGFQNWSFFWRFWHPGSWCPARSQSQKNSKRYRFSYQKITKKQSEKQEIELSGIEFLFDLFEGLADCAQRLNKVN